MTRLFPTAWNLETGLRRVPLVSGLCRGAVATASKRLGGVSLPGIGGPQARLPRLFESAELERRISFEEADISAEEAEAALVLRAGHERAQSRDWSSLAEDITQASRRRAATPGGVRHHTLLQAGALLLLDGAVRDGDTAAADTAVNAFAAAQRRAPTCPVRAALCARAHIGFAWSLRGDGPAADVTQEQWRAVDQRVGLANAVLAGFEGQGGAILAEARYRVAVLGDDVQQNLPPLYAAWAEADPDDAAPMEMHGFYLLPQWGGDFTELERQARCAALRTEATLGFAGYAMLTLPVIDQDPGLLRHLDPALFVEGVDDWLDAHAEPRRVNAFLRRLADLSEGRGRAGKDPFRDYVAEALPDLVARHLRSVVIEAWDGNALRLRQVLSRAYRDHLDAGGTVALSEEGVSLRDAA